MSSLLGDSGGLSCTQLQARLGADLTSEQSCQISSRIGQALHSVLGDSGVWGLGGTCCASLQTHSVILHVWEFAQGSLASRFACNCFQACPLSQELAQCLWKAACILGWEGLVGSNFCR